MLQAPAGVTEADVVVMLQAVLDRHAMLRLRVGDDGARGWSLHGARGGFGKCRRVPANGGRVVRGGGGGGAVAVEPGCRGDAQRGVGGSTSQLVAIIHHLAVDGVSWRIVLEDLNIAWAQHRVGRQMVLPAGGTSWSA